MTTYFCSQRLLYTYGQVDSSGVMKTYYVYAGQANCDHSLPCYTSTYTSAKTLNSQRCPSDPCIEVTRMSVCQSHGTAPTTVLHDFAADAVSLIGKLQADHDTLASCPVPGITYSWTQRIFVKFNRVGDERSVSAQCRQLLITQLQPLSVFVVGVGFEVASVPTGEDEMVPDNNVVTKIDPDDRLSGLYRVRVHGIEYQVICTA